LDFYIFLGFFKSVLLQKSQNWCLFQIWCNNFESGAIIKESVTIIFKKSGDIISKVMLLFPKLCKFFLSVAMIVRVVLLFMSVAVISSAQINYF